LDDQFIVSYSKAGNIRFIPLSELTNEARESVDRKIEYKADRLVAYKNKCMIYEKSSILSGIALYVACIDDNAEIISEKKIGMYQKEKEEESPFLAAIQEKGNAILYDQRSRSLIYCYKNNSNKIAEQVYKYKDLPKQLMYRVAQQIHFINNKAILVFDDQIYEISGFGTNQFQYKRLFHIRSSATEKIKSAVKGLVKSEERSKYAKTIVTTALQENNILWIISSKEFNNKEEQPNIEYVIQAIDL
jgi:hypothetical protein